MFRRSNAAPDVRGNADVRKPGRVFVLVDRHVLAVPIGQRGGAGRILYVSHPPDDDAVRMALDDLLDFAIDGGVVKVDLLALWPELGVVGGREPRYAIARKFAVATP